VASAGLVSRAGAASARKIFESMYLGELNDTRPGVPPANRWLVTH
jgi:hypothetical protein